MGCYCKATPSGIDESIRKTTIRNSRRYMFLHGISRVFRLQVLVLLLGATVCGCATTGAKDDPLKNTKKLVTEGHLSLYKNGAFHVPNTSISLIPAGPGALEFIGELAGVRARQSLETSVRHAAESVYIVSEGTRLTYSLSRDISLGSNKSADEIRKLSRENNILLVYRSSELGKAVVGKSWDLSKKTFGVRERAGEAIIRGGEKGGSAISEAGTRQGAALASASADAAGRISSLSADRSGSALMYAGNAFIKGYAAVPSEMKRRAGEMEEHLSEAKLAGVIRQENETRTGLSQKSVDLMSDTVKNYSGDVAATVGKAGKELQGSYSTTGLSLAMLKSIRWVLQGVLWGATVEPAAKMTAASVGYIGVNLVAFPAMVIAKEGVATTKLAVEVSWDAAKTGYDIVAPTGVAAVAGLYGLLDYTGSNIGAGVTAGAGNVLGYGGAGLSKTAGVLVKGGSYAAGKSVQYIGVPPASAGIAVGGGTIGTAVGGVGTVTGGALLVTAETGAAATQVFGNVIAGGVLVSGTAASTAGGASYGVYELSKAVVVPSGYELTSGVVLSYGTLSHLGAHSILAVSDCAYMVLSLEGPRWVLYAVKGNKDNGEDLPVGAIVDLKKLQETGEEIIYLPVTDEEMKKVVNSVYDNLPEIKSESK